MNTKPIDPKIRLKNNWKILKNRKESFDYRICDDLCEVLLSYLSFSYKIRFECVSKQFQSLVFSVEFHIKKVSKLSAQKITLKAIRFLFYLI